MQWDNIIVALITAVGAFMGVYFANKKQTALMAYRLEVLEKKVDKHNNLEARIIRLEQRLDDMEKRGA